MDRSKWSKLIKKVRRSGCAAKRRQWLGEEMHGVWSRGSKTKRKTKEDLERGYQRKCQARKLNKEDGVDRSKWRKLIKDVRWSGGVWMGECFFWYWPTQVVPDEGPLNGCVCVCVCVYKYADLLTGIGFSCYIKLTSSSSDYYAADL